MLCACCDECQRSGPKWRFPGKHREPHGRQKPATGEVEAMGKSDTERNRRKFGNDEGDVDFEGTCAFLLPLQILNIASPKPICLTKFVC